LLEGNNKNEANNGPKDDVTGASVTANNASARLSSLEHFPNAPRAKKQDNTPPYDSTGDQSSSDDSLLAGVEEMKKSEDASDDSGYRESNDSREESSSSWSDTSRSNDHRKKPLAPTCRMCLIRVDLTTVWCEVTSSIRNKSSDEDWAEERPTNNRSTDNGRNLGTKIDQELLLCLRPIRNGGKKVDESFRFVPLGDQIASPTKVFRNTDPSSEDRGAADRTLTRDNSSNSSSLKHEIHKKRPPKKRLLVTDIEPCNNFPINKRAKADSTCQGPNDSEAEKSVVESLMLMNKSSQ
jgi:hypothetical protein